MKIFQTVALSYSPSYEHRIVVRLTRRIADKPRGDIKNIEPLIILFNNFHLCCGASAHYFLMIYDDAYDYLDHGTL